MNSEYGSHTGLKSKCTKLREDTHEEASILGVPSLHNANVQAQVFQSLI